MYFSMVRKDKRTGGKNGDLFQKDSYGDQGFVQSRVSFKDKIILEYKF